MPLLSSSPHRLLQSPSPRRRPVRHRATIAHGPCHQPQHQASLDLRDPISPQFLSDFAIWSIELAKERKGPLPEKIWTKQQFAIGVNDVTRVLERMPHGMLGVQSTAKPIDGPPRRAPLVPLQAVIVASDCNPRWLIKHIPSLASSRQVPVISIKDSKRGSLRLGELVNLKTALAIGVKAKESKINEVMDAILSGDDVLLLEDVAKMA